MRESEVYELTKKAQLAHSMMQRPGSWLTFLTGLCRLLQKISNSAGSSRSAELKHTADSRKQVPDSVNTTAVTSAVYHQHGKCISYTTYNESLSSTKKQLQVSIAQAPGSCQERKQKAQKAVASCVASHICHSAPGATGRTLHTTEHITSASLKPS